MGSIVLDIRYAFRTLRKRPGFTAVALVTLALGIGANTAIFSVIQSVLLEPLPFEGPDRLVQVWESRVERGWTHAGMNPANFWDFREQNGAFEDLGALFYSSLNLTGLGYPERVSAGFISAGFFRILRVQPALGRTFLPGEDEPGGDNAVVLLSNEYWRTRFAADSAIIGSSLTFDGQSYTVVGVLPAGEPWLDEREVFAPLVRNPDADRVGFYLSVIGRLAPGVSIEAARADLTAVAQRLEEAYPEANEGIGATIESAESAWLAGADLRRALWILLGAVGFLLLIACVNLANLLLAKATGRIRETAVRAALGADRWRIVRQVLTESLVLGLAGAAAGLLLAFWGVDLFKSLEPGGIPRADQVSINGWVLGFTAAVGLLTGVLSGIIPAIQLPRTDFQTALRESSRGTSGARAQNRLRGALVAAEVALSLMLLVGAGLLIRSFFEVMTVDRGFQSESRLVFAVNMPGSYDTGRRGEVRDQLLERLNAMPGVLSAAVNSRPIAGGNPGMGIVPEGWQEEPGDITPWAGWRLVTRDYFRVMGVRLLSGRTFTERDVIGEPWTAIISERLAERLYPGEDPVGRQVILWQGQGDLVAEVIGVVANQRERGLDNDPTLTVYLPYYGAGWSPMQFVVHTTGDPRANVGTVRSMLAEIDPSLPISNIQTLDEIVGNSVAGRRFYMLMLAVFAGVAIVLALAGIYGVQSYSVSRRTSEIGVRVAMGATHKQVIRQIVRQGMQPAAIGIVLGLIAAFGISRLLSSLLFGVASSDPLTYVGVAILLAAAALVACYLPALRALRIDPVNALREE
ncbi:MAG: ABC transporter permease [Gemmatimonadota bacterium]|nr:MAG: ABC transporter permease [Gemmatimonadota bacterium]